MLTQAVLFDLDGTLVDTLPLIITTYRQVFRDLKIPWGDDDVVKYIGLPLVEIGGKFGVSDRDLFVDLYQHYYRIEHDNATKVFPGTTEILKQLKEMGIKLGLVTSKGKPVTTRTLAFTKLDQLLDTVVTAHDVTNPKPHPEAMEKALTALNVQPERAIMVGDSRFDVQAGKNSGTRTLAVAWGLESQEALTKLNPDGLLKTWNEITQYL